MKIIVWLYILTHLSICNALQECCDKNNNFYAQGRCINRSPFRISCREAYEIKVNDSEIPYKIDKANSLIINNEDPIPSKEYCYSRKNATKEEYFIICFLEQPLVEKASTTINNAFQIVSILFIIVTILVYVCVPEMQDLQGSIIIQTISGLACSFMLLQFLHFSWALDDVSCHIVAYLLYLSFLYAFFWLNVLCFHIWKEVIQPKLIRKINNWRLVYNIYGIGGPFIFSIFLILADNIEMIFMEGIQPRIAEGKCWFQSLKETFIYFYGPIAILLLTNIIYFIWTAIVLWNQYNKTQRTKELKYRLQLHSKLFFIMGITWVFEVISAAVDGDRSFLKFIWLVSDALNALEGLIIFLILVVFRKGVIKALAKKTWCGGFIQVPERWRKEDDDDSLEEEMMQFSI